VLACIASSMAHPSALGWLGRFELKQMSGTCLATIL
jgi:hypothetical protein